MRRALDREPAVIRSVVRMEWWLVLGTEVLGSGNPSMATSNSVLEHEMADTSAALGSCRTDADHHRVADPRCPSGMSHADDRLTALKGTGFSPYIKPAKSRGL